MIPFSKTEDYATILVDYLAREYKVRFVSLREIAKEKKLSLLFLRNIALRLRKNGVLTAIEGKKGGYALAQDPKDIKIGAILQAISTKPLFSCCQNTKDGKCHASSCSHEFSLRRVHNTSIAKMAKLTVQDVIEQK